MVAGGPQRDRVSKRPPKKKVSAGRMQLVEMQREKLWGDPNTYWASQRGLDERLAGWLYPQRAPITDREKDGFLEGLLVEGKLWVDLVKDFHRSRESLWRCVGSLCSNDNNCKPYPYTPVERTDRSKADWNKADLYIVRRAVAEVGIKMGAHLPSYLAKILGRNEEKVLEWMRERVRTKNRVKNRLIVLPFDVSTFSPEKLARSLRSTLPEVPELRHTTDDEVRAILRRRTPPPEGNRRSIYGL